MKAKCVECKTVWEYEANDMKVESDGCGLVIALYCPKCHRRTWEYNPNEMAFNMLPTSIDYKLGYKSTYDWE